MEASNSPEGFGSMETSRLEEACSYALPDEATSAEFVLALVADIPNQWCVEGNYLIYTYAKIPNHKGVMTWTLTLEQRVLTGSLPTMSTIS